MDIQSGQRVECFSFKGEKLESKQCEALEEIFRRVAFKTLDLESTDLNEDVSMAT